MQVSSDNIILWFLITLESRLLYIISVEPYIRHARKVSWVPHDLSIIGSRRVLNIISDGTYFRRASKVSRKVAHDMSIIGSGHEHESTDYIHSD